MITAVIGDVASHLGCFIFLKDTVNAIAFVALGTSVPGKWPRSAVGQQCWPSDTKTSCLFTAFYVELWPYYFESSDDIMDEIFVSLIKLMQ